MVDVTDLQPHQRAWTPEDTTCPRCGLVGFVMGYQFIDPETGKHQHTHYVCTAWPIDGERCGWHGWRADSKAVDIEAINFGDMSLHLERRMGVPSIAQIKRGDQVVWTGTDQSSLLLQPDADGHLIDAGFVRRVDEVLEAKSFTRERRREISLMLHRAAGCCLEVRG